MRPTRHSIRGGHACPAPVASPWRRPPPRLARHRVARDVSPVSCARSSPHRRRAPPATPRAAAPVDLTGNWVSLVTEEWRWRMTTPPRGDYISLPLSDEGRRVADTWTPAMDGSCKAYGAGGVMWLPTRLRVSWDGDQVLKVETDAGQQTRLLGFDAARPAGPAQPAGLLGRRLGADGRRSGDCRSAADASPRRRRRVARSRSSRRTSAKAGCAATVRPTASARPSPSTGTGCPFPTATTSSW